MADGGVVTPFGKARVTLRLSDGREMTQNMIVAEIEAPVIFGLDFLSEHRCVLEAAQGVLTISKTPYTLKREGQLPSRCTVTLRETVTIPPGCEMVVPGYITDPPKHTVACIVEP